MSVADETLAIMERLRAAQAETVDRVASAIIEDVTVHENDPWRGSWASWTLLNAIEVLETAVFEVPDDAQKLLASCVVGLVSEGVLRVHVPGRAYPATGREDTGMRPDIRLAFPPAEIRAAFMRRIRPDTDGHVERPPLSMHWRSTWAGQGQPSRPGTELLLDDGAARCVEHDECAEDVEMGRLCWESRRGRHT